MKAGERVQVTKELEPAVEDFTFVGMTGTITKCFPEGAIINIDSHFSDGTDLNDLFFEYAELEKI